MVYKRHVTIIHNGANIGYMDYRTRRNKKNITCRTFHTVHVVIKKSTVNSLC